MKCTCGHPMTMFLVKGERVPFEYECAICGEITEIEEVRMKE